MADVDANQIDVVDDSGQLGSIPKDQFHDAMQAGYRLPTPKELQAFNEKKEYTSGAKPLLAGLAGAARGPSLGLSDVALTKTGLVQPDTLKNLEDYNPIESGVGEAAGIGASLFVPGLGEAAAEQGVARGVARRAAQIATAPMGVVSKVGQGITEGVGAMLPEASTALGRIGQSALTHSAGAAAEGAAFGLGRAISEDSMGDPDALGEKLLSHVGPSALLGGVIGGTLGAGTRAVAEGWNAGKNVYNDIINPKQAVIETARAVDPTIPQTPLGEALAIDSASPEEQKIFKEGQGRRKANANDIEGVAMKHDLPVVDEQLITDEHLLKKAQALRDSGSPFGVAVMRKMQDGWNYWRDKLEGMLGKPSDVSSAELGKSVSSRIVDQISEGQTEFNSRFSEVSDIQNPLRIADEPKIKFLNDVSPVLENTEKFSHDIRVQTNKAAKEITEKNTGEGLVASIKEWKEKARKAWREGDSSLGTALNEVTEKAEAMLHEETVKALGVYGEEAVAKYQQLMKDYAQFKKTQDQIAKGLGLGSSKQAYQLKQALLNKNPQALVKAIFNKNNIGVAEFFKKYAPDIMADVIKFHRSELLDSAIKGEGVALNPKTVLTKYHDMDKEVRNLIFTPEEQLLLKEGGTYIHSYPKNFNGSGSASMIEYIRKQFNIFNPGEMAAQLATLAKDGYTVHKLKQAGLKNADLVHANWVGNTIDKTTKKLDSAAKAVFKFGEDRGKDVIGYGSAKAVDSGLSHEKKKELVIKLHDLNANPESFAEHLHQMTEPINNVAPKTAQAAQATAVRAAQYLRATAPPMKSDYALGEDTPPSDIEMQIFGERINVLNNPISILHELKVGTLVPAHLEAVGQVYPHLLQEMQSQVMQHLSGAIAKKQQIPYQMKNQLSMFLNKDLDSSITAQHVVDNQSAIARSQVASGQQDQQMMGGVKPTQTGLGKLTRSTQALTDMQQSSQRLTKG